MSKENENNASSLWELGVIAALGYGLYKILKSTSSSVQNMVEKAEKLESPKLSPNESLKIELAKIDRRISTYRHTSPSNYNSSNNSSSDSIDDKKYDRCKTCGKIASLHYNGECEDCYFPDDDDDA